MTDGRERILELVREEVRKRAVRPFVPGETEVPYAGRVYDEEEVVAAVASSLDFWLTLGPEGEDFEKELSTFLGVRGSVLANSGSSANLLAVTALTSPKLGDRRLRPGDEVITAAAGFPTTVAPILQNGLVPVFIDSDPRTGNARPEQLADAFREGRTKAVFLAHTLGNPFDLDEVQRFTTERGLFLLEDNCDALGSLYRGRHTGTFGDLSTQSFYPPHHLTMGEGGAVNIVKEARFRSIVESFRDWGRDCFCASGHDDTCGRRFGWKQGELPEGYDHKYIYSHLGYNLKPLDIQAAIGRAQLRKLPSFVAARRRNWTRLHAALADLEGVVELPVPQAFSEPSWFGFMLLTTPRSRPRNEVVKALVKLRIGTRMLFGGNLVRQPAFVNLARAAVNAAEKPFRVVSSLEGADRLMNDALFVGVYPGLSEEQLDYVAASLRKVLLEAS